MQGCVPPRETPAPTPLVAATQARLPEAPLDARPSLAPLVELLADPVARAPGEDALGTASPVEPPPPELSVDLLEVRYGRGQVSLRHFASWNHVTCPLAGSPPGCSTYTLSTPGPSPDEASWNSGVETPLLTGSQSFQAPRPWSAMAGGREVVYALSPSTHTLDRLDAQGRVTPFLEDLRLGDWQSFHVFEQGPRVWLLGHTGRGSLELGEATVSPGPGAPLQLGPLTDLHIAHADDRGVLDHPDARRIMAGQPSFIALDAQRAGRWAMAWLEVIPVPRGEPRYCGKCVRQDPFVPLHDARVKKLTHLTVFEGTKLLDEKTESLGEAEMEPSNAHFLVSFNGDRPSLSLESIRPPAFRWASLSDGHRLSEKAVLLRDEGLLGARYDPSSGEGILVFWSGARLFSRRFDAEGKFLEEARLYPHEVERNLWAPRSLRHFKGRWIALTNQTVLPLSKGAAPQRPAPPGHLPLALLVDHGKLTLLSSQAETLQLTALDEQGKQAGKPRGIGPIARGWMPSTGLAVSEAAGSPPMLAVTFEDVETELWLKVGSLALGAGGWTWPLKIHQNRADRHPISFHEVPGDLAAVIDQRNVATTHWLRAGKTSETPLPEGALRPLLIPPTRPGPLTVVAELGGIDAACPVQLHPGGAATLLVCMSGAEPLKPGIKISLRRWEEAASKTVTP